jgi:hypothetical protein
MHAGLAYGFAPSLHQGEPGIACIEQKAKERGAAGMCVFFYDRIPLPKNGPAYAR